MSLYFCRNPGAGFGLFALAKTESSITIVTFVPHEDEYDESQVSDWSLVGQDMSAPVFGGGVSMSEGGVLVKGIPGHAETVFTCRGKVTFDLNGKSGEDEIIDYSVIDIYVDEMKMPLGWSSRFVESSLGKIKSFARQRDVMERTSIATITIPFKTSSIDDVRVEVKYDQFKPVGLTEDGVIELSEEEADIVTYQMPYVFTHLWKVEPIQVGEIMVSANSSISIPVKIRMIRGNIGVNKVVKLYLDANAGYLPYRSIVTDENGEAEIPFNAMELKPGDEVRIKIGTPVFTLVSKIDIKVI